MHRFARTAAALLLIFTLPMPAVRAQEDAPQGALYLGLGRMLEAQAPRQLSLDAHIAQFLYQPGGLSIAYVSDQPDGDGVRHSVRMVGIHRGETTPLLTYKSADSEDYFHYRLIGWTADTRYLIVRTDQFVPLMGSSDTGFQPAYSCIDVGTTPIQIRSIALALPPPSKSNPVRFAEAWWPPSRSRLLIDEHNGSSPLNPNDTRHVYSLYSPAQDKTETFTLPTGESVGGWLDESHLLLVSQKDDQTHYFTWELAASKQREIPPLAKMPDQNVKDSSDISPKSPALSLTVETHFQPDKQGVTGVNSHLLWLRRATAPRLLSAMSVGLTPGLADPSAVWSPNGKQIAFLDHGDLWVTDLTEREATPKERYLAGEKLSCPEERFVAAESLKQIGLAIMKYTQDNDECYPAQSGVNGSIRPYLPPDALLSVGGHPFVYHAPSNLSLAADDSPANNVLGTIDLPCGRVALYADGHVKSPPRPVLSP